MDNAVSLAAIVGPTYLLIGLSLLFYGKSWQNLLEKYQKDHYKLFLDALLTFIFGLVMIRMYNVWEWNLWLLVTLTGWGLLFKGAFYFLAPGKWITAILKLKDQKWIIYLGALLSLVIGFALSYMVYLK